MLSTILKCLTPLVGTTLLSCGGHAVPCHRVRVRLESLDERVLPSTVYAEFGDPLSGGYLVRWQDRTSQVIGIEAPYQFASADAREVFGIYSTDYRDHGLWRWSVSDGWQQLGTEVPYIIATGSYGEVFAAYDITYKDPGLRRWTVSNGWQFLDSEYPDTIAAPIGSFGEVFAVYRNSYSDHGLWRWSRYWQQLGTEVPYLIATGSSGEVFAAYSTTYSDHGLWRWTDSNGWQQVGTESPYLIATSTYGEAFSAYGDRYSDHGVWRWTDSNGWQYLDTEYTDGIFTGSYGELFDGYGYNTHRDPGLWRWSGDWQQLSTEVPGAITTGLPGEVFTTYGIFYSNHGLWRWSTSDGWAQLSSDVPSALLYAPDNGGAPHGSGSSRDVSAIGTTATNEHDALSSAPMRIITPTSPAIPTETAAHVPDVRRIDGLVAASVPRDHDIAPLFPNPHSPPAFDPTWSLLFGVDTLQTDAIFSTVLAG